MSEQTPGTATPKNFELLTNDDKQKIVLKLREVPKDQVEKFIYQNKRQEWALTAEGTKWVVREMADKGEAIRMDGHPKVERDLVDPEWMTCSVLGKRVKVDREGKSEMILDSNIGSSRTWIKQKLGKDDNAKVIPDEFWYTKLVSKATRNLQQSMIPNDFKKAIIVKLQEIKNGKAGGAPSQQSQQRPQGQTGQQTQHPPQGQQGQHPPQGESRPPGSAAPAGSAPHQGSQQKPQQQRPPQGQPQQPQKQSPATASLEVVHQGFRVVFIQWAKTEDKTTLQKLLKALTGKTGVTDLERGEMAELGPILRRAIKGEVKFNGTALHEIKTGSQLWPKHAPEPEPSPEPQHEEAPPPQEEPMF